MNTTKLNIPNTITVGYQERGGTYTGKLSYVIYTDAKGVLRKEKSWNSWRSNSIDPDTFKNEPTSGFVLNKGVGGARNSYGWNARNEYIRIYDPRGFEFEISVANLLFILQETNSIKGKGLEGEFVYSWHGKDLVLLPTKSHDYTECLKFTKMQSGKVYKKDIRPGQLFKAKSGITYMYMGHHRVRDFPRYRCPVDRLFSDDLKKKFVFYNMDNSRFIYYSSLQPIAECVDSSINKDYAKIYDEFMDPHKTFHVAEIRRVDITDKFLRYLSTKRISTESVILTTPKGEIVTRIESYGNSSSYIYGRSADLSNLNPENTVVDINTIHKNYRYDKSPLLSLSIIKKNLEEYKVYTLEYTNSKGDCMNVENFVRRERL